MMKNDRRRTQLAILTLVLLSLALGATAQEVKPRYKLTDLGALSGFPYSRAYGINNKGQVVGQVAKIEPKLEAHAVLWDGNKVQDVTTPTGLPYGSANGINDRGEVVGGSEIDNYGSHAFDFMGLPDQAYLLRNGKTKALSTGSSHAFAINDNHQIVGEIENQAELWEQGKPTKLKTPQGVIRSSAQAINQKGQVAGIIFTPEFKRQACLWSGGEIKLLGDLPGDDQSIANAVNDKGHVVGSSGKNNSYWDFPFLWEDGAMKMLTPFDGRIGDNQVLGINNQDQIVGCGEKDGRYMHAVLWENQIPQDLNDLITAGLGLVLMKAIAINEKGQIVGEARDNKDQIHAFLLTPIKGVTNK